MNVQISPELEALVNEKVAAGDAVSQSAVVEQALRFALDQDGIGDWHLDDLRNEVEKGRRDIREGRISTMSADQIKQRLRQFVSGVSDVSA